jgi:hypothetical protein
MTSKLLDRIAALLEAREKYSALLSGIDSRLRAIEGGLNGASEAKMQKTRRAPKTKRGSMKDGTSQKAKILAAVADGAPFRAKDLVGTIGNDVHRIGIALAQLAIDGLIVRVSLGVYQRPVNVTAPIAAEPQAEAEAVPV